MVHTQLFTPAGNSWGTNDDGHSCVGCGPQEEFYGCSDVAIKQSSQHHQDDAVDSPDTPMAEPSAPYNPQGTSAPYNPQEPSSPTIPQHQDEPKPPKVDVTSGSALPRNPVTNNCIGAPGFEGNKHMERCVYVRIVTTKHTRKCMRIHTHARTRIQSIVFGKYVYTVRRVAS